MLPTWLEGDLTEHHPSVSKMVLAFDGAGHAVVERHCDKPSTGVDVIQDKGEWDSIGLPFIGFRAEIALDFLKDLHPFSKHVVTVDLTEKEACEWQAGSARLHGNTAQAHPVDA